MLSLSTRNVVNRGVWVYPTALNPKGAGAARGWTTHSDTSHLRSSPSFPFRSRSLPCCSRPLRASQKIEAAVCFHSRSPIFNMECRASHYMRHPSHASQDLSSVRVGLRLPQRLRCHITDLCKTSQAFGFLVTLVLSKLLPYLADRHYTIPFKASMILIWTFDLPYSTYTTSPCIDLSRANLHSR